MSVNYVTIKLIPPKSKVHNRLYGIRPSVLNKKKKRDNLKYINIHTFAGMSIQCPKKHLHKKF